MLHLALHFNSSFESSKWNHFGLMQILWIHSWHNPQDLHKERPDHPTLNRINEFWRMALECQNSILEIVFKKSNLLFKWVPSTFESIRSSLFTRPQEEPAAHRRLKCIFKHILKNNVFLLLVLANDNWLIWKKLVMLFSSMPPSLALLGERADRQHHLHDFNYWLVIKGFISFFKLFKVRSLNFSSQKIGLN